MLCLPLDRPPSQNLSGADESNPTSHPPARIGPDQMKKIMHLLAVIVASAIAACATSEDPYDKDPIANFITVERLEPVTKVRTEGNYRFIRVNENYVILKTPRAHYLGQLRNKCPGLMRRTMAEEGGSLLLRSNVDIRTNPKVFYAGQDTILGCVVENLFELEDSVVAALMDVPPPP